MFGFKTWNDVSANFYEWEYLLEQLGGASFINFERDIWEQARQSEDVPHLGNIRQQLLLERLADWVKYCWPFLETGYYVNAADSHFYVNDEPVNMLHDLDCVLGAYLRKQGEAD